MPSPPRSDWPPPDRVIAGLTPRQRQLLDFLAAFIARHGHSPSFAQMRDGLGLASTSTIVTLVLGLERRGRIVRQRGRHRSVRLVPSSPAPDAPQLTCAVSHETPEVP
ncbi:MAG: LexA family protein [Pseudorhodoplanes sp.]